MERALKEMENTIKTIAKVDTMSQLNAEISYWLYYEDILDTIDRMSKGEIVYHDQRSWEKYRKASNVSIETAVDWKAVCKRQFKIYLEEIMEYEIHRKCKKIVYSGIDFSDLRNAKVIPGFEYMFNENSYWKTPFKGLNINLHEIVKRHFDGKILETEMVILALEDVFMVRMTDSLKKELVSNLDELAAVHQMNNPEIRSRFIQSITGIKDESTKTISYDEFINSIYLMFDQIVHSVEYAVSTRHLETCQQ